MNLAFTGCLSIYVTLLSLHEDLIIDISFARNIERPEFKLE